MRAFLFVVFFIIGAAVMCFSILADDVLSYHRNRQLLKAAETSLKRLESLINDYDALLQQLEKDPNLIKRIGPAVLGTEPANANAVYPKVRADELAAAREILTRDSSRQPADSREVKWLARCSEPYKRITLFLAGAVLILISFVCFGKQKSEFRARSKSNR